jgi:hypothetical protein
LKIIFQKKLFYEDVIRTFPSKKLSLVLRLFGFWTSDLLLDSEFRTVRASSMSEGLGGEFDNEVKNLLT